MQVLVLAVRVLWLGLPEVLLCKFGQLVDLIVRNFELFIEVLAHLLKGLLHLLVFLQLL